ncbi:MAG: hypothetical protein DRI69_08540 [Bacteroidetes bacterium]|nr:MAG: hypothetical protein DRI69_08540 [Bacteroidota bacterium]
MTKLQNKDYPFKFLDPYTREDYHLFFGRSQEVNDLYRRVFKSSLLLVYGKSGTGKTSLVQCGLSGRFSDRDWVPLFIRRGMDFNDAFEKAITDCARTPIDADSTPYEKIESLYLDHFKPVYCIFDQFEELFILGDPLEQMRFVRDIASILDKKVPVKVILVMREEYLAQLYEFERVLPTVMDNRLRIELMGRNNAREVINGSCGVADPPIKLERDVDELIINTITQEKGRVELTYLQVFLDKLFRLSEVNQDGSRTFTSGLIAEAGSITDILKEFVDKQINEFTLAYHDKALPVNFLRVFTTRQGTKIPLRKEDVNQKLAVSTEKLNLCFEFFVSRRVLRPLENDLFELLHDSIALYISNRHVLEFAIPDLPVGKEYSADPVVGFSPYSQAHSNTFFGRTWETTGLFNFVMNDQLSRITIVYGKLGVGKTSLLLAGLIPRISQYKTVHYIKFSRWLVEEQIKPYLDEDDYTGSSLYNDVKELKDCVVVWDQMEELFINLDYKELKPVFNFLSNLYTGLSEVQFVWCIREDYFASLIDLESHIPDLMAKRRRINRFSEKQGREVLQGVNKYYDLAFDTPQLFNSFIDKLKSSDGSIEPVYLQMYLKRITQQSTTDR